MDETALHDAIEARLDANAYLAEHLLAFYYSASVGEPEYPYAVHMAESEITHFASADLDQVKVTLAVFAEERADAVAVAQAIQDELAGKELVVTGYINCIWPEASALKTAMNEDRIWVSQLTLEGSWQS